MTISAPVGFAEEHATASACPACVAAPSAERIAQLLPQLADPARRPNLRAQRPLTVTGPIENIVVTGPASAATERFRDRMIGDIARELGKDPVDAMLDIAVADDLRTDFAGVFGFCASGEATIPEGGVIFANELFAMLKTQQLSIGALNDDATDYRQRLRVAANEEEQDAAIQMIAMKRLAKTCNKNLDTAFAALFPETLQASLALSVAA